MHSRLPLAIEHALFVIIGMQDPSVPDPPVSPEEPGLNHVAVLEINTNALTMAIPRGSVALPIVERVAWDVLDNRADQILLLELLGSRLMTNKVVGGQLAPRFLIKFSVYKLIRLTMSFGKS